MNFPFPRNEFSMEFSSPLARFLVPADASRILIFLYLPSPSYDGDGNRKISRKDMLSTNCGTVEAFWPGEIRVLQVLEIYKFAQDNVILLF